VEKTQIAAQVEVGKVQQKHTQVVGETGERGGTYIIPPFPICNFRVTNCHTTSKESEDFNTAT